MLYELFVFRISDYKASRSKTRLCGDLKPTLKITNWEGEYD